MQTYWLKTFVAFRNNPWGVSGRCLWGVSPTFNNMPRRHNCTPFVGD
jgi:hypothetical protein